TSVQYAALAMVREVPDIDQVRLSSLIAFDKTTIVKVLDRLVDKGLVTRTRSPEDRRSNLLHVTDNGLKLLKQIEPLLDRSDKRIVHHLDPVAHRQPGAALQVLDAADVGRHDGLRLQGRELGELAVAQRMRKLRLQYRVGAGRAAAQVAVAGGELHVEAQRLEPALDIAAQLLAMLQC